MPSPDQPAATAPLPLSVATVCCNNRATIGRLLESVQGLSAEIIAVDSGSTDSTIDMLKAAGARVVHQPWLGYVRQKQAALDLCTKPWVLHLDSDESVEPALRRSIEGALQRDDPDIAGYEINRKVWYAGAFLEHTWQPEWRLRLVRRGRARWGGYDPHDDLQLIAPTNGATGAPARIDRLSGDMRHDTMPSLGEFLERQARHARTAAASQFTMGRRGSLMRMVISPAGEWLKQVVLRSAWRDGWRGMAAATASSVGVAMKHALLLEATRNAQRGERR